LNIKSSYHKILQTNQGKAVLEQFPNLMKNDLNVLVYNFVDMMSHARTDMKMIRELAPDESAYRSLTTSWFLHSSLFELFQKISAAGCRGDRHYGSWYQKGKQDPIKLLVIGM
jgi:D-mannonate dehydratase